MNSIEHRIKSTAYRLGFSQCGIAEAVPLDELRDFYASYLEQKWHTAFPYLEKQRKKRLDPRLLAEGVRSVIAVSLNYYPSAVIPETDNFVIAKYAYDGDHYTLIKKKLHELAALIHSETGATTSRIFVDSGPVLEKYWAQRCGIGWIGKNSLLIHKTDGSFHQLGILFTDLPLTPDPPGTDHCGSCERCITACPTGALKTPYVLEIPRCIAFHTIENTDDIPPDLAKNLNGRIFGCDICQDVCPFNKSAKAREKPFFPSNHELHSLKKEDWISLSEDRFHKLFDGTPVKRRGFHLFRKTILAAEGMDTGLNTKDTKE